MEQSINGITYQYQILRYRHDIVSGEFANLGIVFFDSKNNVLKAKFVSKYKRLSQFFGNISSTFLMRTLRQLEKDFSSLAKSLKKESSIDHLRNINDLTTSVIPKDDNALLFSNTFSGWHFEFDLAFNEIYNQVIEKYQDVIVERHNDAYAWKAIYKKHFDKYGITSQLKPKSIKTNFTTIEFDKTVKNSSLHCFQSLSFDLKHEGSIEEKIYRWYGRTRELATAKQPLKVYLLSILPKNDKLTQMIKEKLNFSDESNDIEVKVIDESEAHTIAATVNTILLEHH